MACKCLFTPLLFWGIFLQLFTPAFQSTRHKRSISPELPRIMTQNGHLVFKSGVNHNISFQAVTGGFINIGNEDLNVIIRTVKENKQSIDQLKTISTTEAPSNLASRLSEIERRLNDLQPTGQILSQLTDLSSRINNIESGQGAYNTRLTQLEQSISTGGSLQRSIQRLNSRITTITRVVLRLSAQNYTGQDERVRRFNGRRNGTGGLTRRIRRLERRVNQLRSLLIVNECESNPCRNGATCVDTYNGFICRCPSTWQGLTCEQDVNECSIYAGTDLGCQNGATCINSQGGFSCRCTADWHGVLCSERHDDCTGASNEQMCGHGTCINVQRTHSNMPKYRCICDDGWTNSGSDPACTVDVNECTQRPNACSQDPPVLCINLPGSFQCGSCPTGYVGNGFSCSDVNECETNNGGCSLAPRVDCVNTRGSRVCGPCPSGYVGNGITCSWVGVCGQNNGGCHPQATCTEGPGYQGRICTCPQGYVGNGVGSNGCSLQGPVTGACASSPCRNGGLCQNSGISFRCVCNPGYGGATCNININECASNPCQNGGTCVDGVNSYTCQCTATFSGANCQEQQQSCGGNFAEESGSITYPATPGTTYPHGVDCAWNIRAPNYNKIIMMTFTRFSVEQHPECNFDYLQIHDGSTAAHHRIGKYCGSTLPNGGVVNTTQRNAYLWFHSDNSYSHNGFALSWRAVAPVCGGDLSGSEHGIISSPGYPGNYPNDRDCVWRVTVSPGNNIMFAFAALSLEFHPNCSHDYLQIRDGLTDTSRLLGTYCNSTTLPSPLTTTGPHGYILFHTDHSIASHGFQITYAAVPAGPQCGGTLTAADGTFTSPNYPSPYNHDATCVWVITVHEGDQITLTFTAMDLESHDNCEYDYVLVRDGGNEDSNLIGRYCGSDIPATLTSSGNSLYVEFRSDISNAGTGFRASYNTGCGGTYSGESGTIQSPYYPNAYPADKECTYLISVPQGSRVTLTFNSFDVEADGSCNYDYVEVRDGLSADSDLLGKFCGSNGPDPVSSTANTMFVKFVSDGSVNNNGFQATYSAAESTACGGTLTDSTGSFTSPGHPNVHPHGVNCTWFIRVDPGLVIRLTFNAFSLEGGVPCMFDYVEVFDNSTATPGSSLGRKCGSLVPPVVTSTNNYMTVQFVSDSSIAHEGFHVSYVALNASTLCGDYLTDSTGVITSPNYPRNYPHNRECIWTIVASEGTQIQLNITSFELESHTSCAYDFLEIRNGGFQSSPLVGTQPYCGTVIPPTIVSDSNRMFLKFVSDGSSSAKGFRIYYDATATGCGADLTAPSGGFVSPNYPHPYSHNAECFWTITVARGNTVTLVFVDFFLEDHHRCSYDYVEVREEGPRGKLLAHYCGNQTPDPVTSSTNKLWVKYRTDSSVNGRGFHATYYTNCNIHLTSWSGVIESPNFPNPYYNNRNCTWTIQTTMGNTINASFSHFDVETHTSCQYDHLQIRDGDSMTANEIGTYCGETIPPPIASSGETLWINFISDYSMAGNGFRLEYITNGCGGYFTSPTGSFTSPGYPQPYPHRRECVWHISLPTGSAVELTLEDFDLETHSSCRFDVLEIYEGTDGTGPLLTKICHKQKKAQVLTSTGNSMYIRFASDGAISGNGFRASYKAVTGGCGGNFSTPTGTIMSKNYPENYPHNTECEWLITVMEGRSVDLTFLDFDVEGSAGVCQFDYVAGYDGTNTNSPELFKHCGTAVPSPNVIKSIGNQMFIKMRTDNSVSARGFKATYTTGCGGELSAELDGVLSSPNYPQPYGPLNNCTWVIRGEHSNDRVTLTFTHMDLELNRICNHDYVIVYDGDDTNGTEVGTYCGNTIPAPITSQGSAMTVTFVSDMSVQMSGFRAVFTKSVSSCGGNFTSERGSFTSPGYPNEYPMNTECVWTVYASPGNQIMIAFRLEDHLPNCNMDYLELREGNVHGRLIGRYCGYDVPSNITAMNGLWMKFRSDDSMTEQGFVAQYSSVYGGMLTGNSGQVASPRYPNNYPNNADYVWTISTDVGTVIRISVLALDMEPENGRRSCFYDYLEFRDGDTADSPVLSSLCGTTLPDPFYSTTNQLRVRFRTDFSSVGQGFLFTWEATSDVPTTTTPGPSTSPVPGCGGTITASLSPVTITSPGYPDGYQRSLNCLWTVRVPDGNRVWANITDIDLESHGQCSYDYVEFKNRFQRRGTSLGRFCGREGNPQPIISDMSTLRINFITDYSINRTGFSIQVKQVCGGQIHGSSGVVSSDNYPSAYLPNSNCTWMVTVPRGRTIRVQFNGTFNIAGSGSSCQGDYIQLLNGASSTSPPLGTNQQGKYCGTTPPATMETSSYMLRVGFVSNGNNNAAGFSLIFNEVRVTCGGHLTLSDDVSSTVITSPNYPDNYPHNVECVWVITAPANERIQVDFDNHFYIESHSRFDYIELRDGGTTNSQSLGRFCSRTTPGTVKSTGNVLFARFRADSSFSAYGFKANVKIATCGGTIKGQSGYIQSPNFPAPYDSNSNCEWYIHAPTGHYLTFTFLNFNLQFGSNCSVVDFVEIREYNATGPLLKTACGTRVPGSVDTSDSFAYVRFQSNSAINGPGFKLAFSASVEACGGDLTTPIGTFMSPNYPGQYPHSRTCEWRIKVQQGRRVSLTFDNFNIESHGRCQYDYVEIYNGLLPNSPRMALLCGETNPGLIESYGNAMRVVFKTDGSVSNGGFRASYTSDNDAVCGGVIRESGGNITSIGYPTGNYSNNVECIWVIQNPSLSDSTIMVDFEDFALESHGDCIYDFIEIREGTDENGELLGLYCGNQTTPGPVMSPMANLWVRFRTDYSAVDRGFRIMFIFTDCGGVLTSPSGVISTPNFPNFYNHSDACAWLIQQPEGYRVNAQFTNFSLEYNRDCNYDYIEILNGGLPTSPSTGKFCGNHTITNFVSQTNAIRVIFKSDISINDHGFQMTYYQSAGGCGGMIHSNSGNISSPNYPQSYPHLTECVWDINVEKGYHIILTFIPPFDLEAEDNCDYDFVEVDDALPNNTLVPRGRWCRNLTPPQQITSSNRIVVRFQSDRNTNGNGFAANWTTGCGAIFTDEYADFYSPGFPNGYSHNLVCNYTILGAPGRFIVMTFSGAIFDVEGPASCVHDSLTVYQGNDTRGRQLGKFCGQTFPQPVSGEGSLFLQFKTDSSVSGKGFRVSYRISDCGGDYTDESAYIYTPTHPTNYHHNANCTWRITVQEDRIVSLKFTSFDIEAHETCNYDYVDVYDGDGFDSPLIGRYCGDVLPNVIRSTGNTMFINFITDWSVSKAGFSAVYRTTYGSDQGCGGILNSTSGSLTSVDSDRDGQYEHNLDCIWRIIVGDNKIVKLTITGMDIENHTTCYYDYLEIRDGFNIDDPSKGKYCGSRLPPVITSISNVLLVRFYTDSSIAGGGFNATYVQENALCGGTRTASDSPQTLTSPGYPNPVYQQLNCRWTIDTPDPNQNVRLMVSRLDLMSQTMCQDEYIEFRDSPLGDLGKSVHYCGTSKPDVFDSIGNTVQVNLAMLGLPNSRSTGFTLKYQIANCNRTYSGTSGQIYSPGWPGKYPINSYCEINISAPPGTSLSLYFNYFQIEPHTSCQYDGLLIRNGSSGTDFANLCGLTIPDPVFLPSNTAWMQFHTDNSITHPGFSITYTASYNGMGCGGNITGINGSLTNPGYPSNNTISQTCGWLITTPARRTITVTFTNINVFGTPSCSTDYLEVFNGPNQYSSRFGRYCTQEPIAPLQANTNQVYIKYVSSGSGSPFMFRLEYFS